MNETYTPLTTFQGLPAVELKKIVNTRQIIIWGVGIMGKTIKKILNKLEFNVKNYCDANEALLNKTVDNIKVISPQSAIALAKKNKAIIIISSQNYRVHIENECQKNGLKLKSDYLLFLHIPRPEAIIEVISKPIDDTGRPQKLTYERYKPILNKLVKEIPLISNIRFIGEPDPLLNPNLADIVSLTQTNTHSSVISKLTSTHNLEQILQANPTEFVVEIHYSSANTKTPEFKKLVANLNTLSTISRRIGDLKTDIKVMFHLYKNNQNIPLKYLKETCQKLNLKFVTAFGYIEPYEQILSIQKHGLKENNKNTIKELAWNFNEAISLSQKDQSKPCLCQRIFPVINVDGSINQCEVFADIKVADAFLNISIENLINRRNNNPHCKECQAYSLHRLDIDVLLYRHKTNNLLNLD